MHVMQLHTSTFRLLRGCRPKATRRRPALSPSTAICLHPVFCEAGMVRRLLRGDQYEHIAQLLPGKAGGRGRPAIDNREFVEAVSWIARTGSPWRDLPEEFGRWNSIYKRFARGSQAGMLPQSGRTVLCSNETVPSHGYPIR
ncbi:transposase [Burkholderia cepacia]